MKPQCEVLSSQRTMATRFVYDGALRRVRVTNSCACVVAAAIDVLIPATICSLEGKDKIQHEIAWLIHM